MRLFLSQPWLLTVVLVLALLGASIWGLSSGPLALPWSTVLANLVSGTASSPEQTILLELRLPRVVLALLIGAALAQAGTVMQALFRNPLADPGLVGVASGAALAAAGVMTLGAALLPQGLPWAPAILPLASFVGGLATAALVMRLALVDGYTRVATMLLAGLAINALAGAGIGLLAQVASETALRNLMFWMFGSLGKAGWTEIAFAAPLLLLCLGLMARQAGSLNALLLGEAEAGHLGVAVESLKRRLMLLIVMAVAASVALAGVIGFIGLVVPNLVRLCYGPDHRYVLPASALLGAILLTLADTASRVAFAPLELPVGILTALLGAPFFLALLVWARRDPETL